MAARFLIAGYLLTLQLESPTTIHTAQIAAGSGNVVLTMNPACLNVLIVMDPHCAMASKLLVLTLHIIIQWAQFVTGQKI